MRAVAFALLFGVLGVLAGLVGACCPPVPEPVHAGTGTSGSATAGSATAGGASACDAARDHVKQLYSAAPNNAALADDNTAMVMKDCAKQPDKVAACAASATSVAQLEHDCLIPLDAEGTEGDQLKQ